MQIVQQKQVPRQDPVLDPSRRLYSSGQITGATLLGTPIAGAWLMAQNYKAMGLDLFARQAIIFGIIGTLIVLVLAVVLPENTPNILLPAIYTVIVQVIARAKQGADFLAHIANGGFKHSNWRVVGIGVVFMVFVFLFFAAVLLVMPERLWILLGGAA